MPEGHTIHRAARRQNAVLAGHALRVSSPQGRFAAGAAALDGRVLLGVEAVGKHLFQRWEGDEVLHVHLGLFGRFREQPSPPEPPRGAVRLRVEAPEVTMDLSGPTACELVGEEGMARIVDRLGQDPLRGDADPDRASPTSRAAACRSARPCSTSGSSPASATCSAPRPSSCAASRRSVRRGR